MSLESELAELSTVNHNLLEKSDLQTLQIAALTERCTQLERLVKDYDNYLKAIAPHSYQHSRVVLSFHRELDELGIAGFGNVEREDSSDGNIH